MLKKLLTYICMFLVGTVGFLCIYSPEKGNQLGIYEVSAADAGETTIMNNGKEVDNTSTQSSASSKTQDKTITDMINSLIAGWNIVLGLLTAIVSPAIMVASWLMSPDWTSGDMFGIRPILHTLWVLIANVTYFVYAILLIFIALATIFNSDKYGYKQLLPKLALGILLVPLTWWFIQFIISLSSIVTASVMNIPMEALQANTQTNPTLITSPSIRKKYIYENDITKKEVGEKKPCETNDSDANPCISPQKMLESAGGIYSPLLIYAYSIFKVGDIKNVDGIVDGLKSGTQVVHQVIFGAIMFTVFGLLVLALLFMLMMRAIKLWFYAIFSPLMTLKYVIGDGFFGGKENSDTFELKEFIGLAFVPALVGISLSFGLVIVSLLQSPTAGQSSVTKKPCTDEIIKTGCEIIGLMGNPENKIIRKVEGEKPNMISINTIKIGGVEWEYRGRINGTSDITDSVNTTKSVLSAAGGIFGTLIIDIIALVFIWVAFMAAKNVSKAVKAAVSPFEELGNKIGKFGMSLPKYAPILPGGISISGANKLADRAVSIPEEISSKKTKESRLGTMLGMNGQADTVALKKAQDYMKNDSSAFAEYSTRHREILGELMKNSGTYIEKEAAYKEYMEGMYKKHDGNQASIESALKTNGMNEESAKIIAEKIKNKKFDLGSDPTLLKAWKETATKPGTSSTSGSGPIVGAIIENKIRGKDDLIIQISGVGVQFKKDGDKSLKEITNLDGLKDKKDIIKKDEFKTQLVSGGMSPEQADMLIVAIEKSSAKDFFKKP